MDENFTLKILHEDNHLLAVDKPAGLPSQPDDSGDAALDSLAQEYVRVKYRKPGEAYIALLHRLDRPTSGVVLLAKTGKAAARMADLFRRRAIEKNYMALVDARQAGDALSASGELRQFLEPGSKGGMRVASGKTAVAREARLSWRVLGRSHHGGLALLSVDLHTGVKHQIRCQLAAMGCPVVGDFRYGPHGGRARPDPVMGGRAILLHASRLGFVHPVRKEAMEVTSPFPDYWHGYLGRLA